MRGLGYAVDKTIKAPRKSISQKDLLMHFRIRIDWITSGTSGLTNTKASQTLFPLSNTKITASTHLPQRIYNIKKGNKRSSGQILIRWS